LSRCIQKNLIRLSCRNNLERRRSNLLLEHRHLGEATLQVAPFQHACSSLSNGLAKQAIAGYLPLSKKPKLSYVGRKAWEPPLSTSKPSRFKVYRYIPTLSLLTSLDCALSGFVQLHGECRHSLFMRERGFDL
jgi:hypothetical protein